MLWKIEPLAGRHDTRWLDFPLWAEVIVRAPTAALARRVAVHMEQEKSGDEAPTGNESHGFRSGFEDAKLYTVKRLDPRTLPDTAAEGPDEVLSARKPAQVVEAQRRQDG